MITIEASNINVGGSFSLLKDIATYCNETNRKTRIYIIYDTVYKGLLDLNLNNVELIKTNIVKTIYRYCIPFRKNVLYFCSLPPLSTNRNALLYFHAEYYATKPFDNTRDLSLIEKIHKVVYYPWIKFCARNCRKVLCQTEHIKKLLQQTYNIHAEIRPFFRHIEARDGLKYEDREYDFIYPALTSKHKNHLLLLDAIEEECKSKKFKFILTIPETAVEILKRIDEINSKYPDTIVNWGILPHDKILSLLQRTKWLFFPSLMESLGIPLIEAQRSGAKVASSNLDYSKASISNPVLFEPADKLSMVKVMDDILIHKYDNIKQDVIIKDSKDYILNCLDC